MLRAATVGVAFAAYLAFQARRLRAGASLDSRSASEGQHLAESLNLWRSAVRDGVARRDGGVLAQALPFSPVSTSEQAERAYDLAVALSSGLGGLELPRSGGAPPLIVASAVAEAALRIREGERGVSALLERVQRAPVQIGSWRYSLKDRHPNWSAVPDGRLPAACDDAGCIPTHWERDTIVRTQA